MQTLDCPECGAIHARRVRFCEECGAPLGAEAQRERRREDADERRGAYRALVKAQNAIKVVRTVFVLLAVLYGFLLLLFVSAALGGDTTGGAALLTLGLATGMLALAVLGAVDVRRRPFLWATILAAFQSLNVIVSTLAGGASFLGYLFALGLWVFVARTAQIRRLLAEHPDLSIARRMRGERAVRGSVVDRAEERARELASARNRKLGIAALVGAGLAAAWLALLWVQRPDAPETAVAAFVADWNARGPVVAAGAVLVHDPETDLGADLSAVALAREWRAGAPTLGAAGELERPGDEVAIARHAFGDGELVTKWRLDDRTWRLFALRPPFDGTDERFRAAWNRSRIGDVAAFFRRAEKIDESLRRIAAQRDWDVLPRLDTAAVAETSIHRRTATYPSDEGPVEVKFKHEGVRWSAVGLKPPPRR